MSPAALLFTALLAAPPVGAEEPASGPPSAAARPATLVVRARGLDEDALQRALRPRSGGAAVVLLRDLDSVDPDHTFVDVELRPPDLAVTIILHDGRVFVRRAPAAGGPRDAARLVASMLVAIADDALAPLPERAVSPALAGLAAEPPAPARVADAPQDVLVPEPAPPPASPEPASPAPATSPSGQERSDMSADPAPEPPALPAPRDRSLALDLTLAGAPILGLGVPDAGLRGGGGELRLDLRGDRPWLVFLAVRTGGARALAEPGPAGMTESFGLLRVRVSLGAGAWLRRGRFELRAAAGLTVEPWLVTHAGRRVRRGDGLAPAPLLGAFLRLAPGLAVSRRMHLGVFAELAAGAAPSGRAVQVLAGDTRLFTLGGLEASLGVELRIALRSSRPGLSKH